MRNAQRVMKSLKIDMFFPNHATGHNYFGISSIARKNTLHYTTTSYRSKIIHISLEISKKFALNI